MTSHSAGICWRDLSDFEHSTLNFEPSTMNFTQVTFSGSYKKSWRIY
jgi:hypothetical protein